jgi:hypothetical protein
MHGLPQLSRSRGPLETRVGVLPKVALSVVFLEPKYDKNTQTAGHARKTKITNLDRSDAESIQQPAIMTQSTLSPHKVGVVWK